MRGQMIPAIRNGIEISLRFLENVVQISEKIKIYSVYFAVCLNFHGQNLTVENRS